MCVDLACHDCLRDGRQVVMNNARDNIALYEQEAHWNRNYLEDPFYRSKVRLIQGMTPDGVKTVLDVGCGNGTIINAFDSDYWVVGCDRSKASLGYVRGRAVQSSADALPFMDRSFDLVMSHQMLEHLPNGVLERTVKELMRVSARYLMVSVPHKDRLAQQLARCAMCGEKYHIWGHLRCFNNVSDLRRLFPSFSLRVHAFCGRENEYMTKIGLGVRQRIGGRWAYDPIAVCPLCGSREQYQAGFPRRAIAAIVDRLDRLIPKQKEFWWLVCLFERSDCS